MVSVANSSTRKSSSKGKSGKRNRIDPEINELAEKRLGSRIAKLQYPGGKSRRSCRAILRNGKSVIVSKRKTLKRSQLECQALRTLSKADMPVPQLLCSDGRLFFQEDVGDRRLSTSLHDPATSQERLALLDSAVVGLSAIQNCASQAGLDSQVPLLGSDKAWRQEFAERPGAIGKHLGVAAPDINIEAVADAIAVRQPRFVKWDSRPGNALVDADNTVIWIDWEHCGARNRLDDLAWLLADEYVEDDVAVEDQLIDRHLDKFGDGLDSNSAFEYLMTYGTLHMCIRLGLILDRKGDDDWWDEEYCLAGDKIGVTRQMAERQCRRAGRWAANSRMLSDLSDWFEQARIAIAKL